MLEVWKDICGYEGFYQVSNLGRVRSVDRTVARSNYFVRLKSQIMKQTRGSTGYMRVNLCKDNIATLYYVHRLVAEAFILNTDNKPEINHKDGDKTNNKVENLEWCLRAENMLHSYNVLGNRRYGKNNPKSQVILQIQNDKVIGRFYGSYEAYRKTGISPANINSCCHHNRPTAGKYKWRYENEDL